MKFGLFFSVFTILILLFFALLYYRFFKTFLINHPSPLYYIFIAFFYITMFLMITLPPFLYRRATGVYEYQGTLFQIIKGHYLTFGMFTYLLVFILATTIIELCLKSLLSSNLLAHNGEEIVRRDFFKFGLNLFAVGASFLATGLAYFKAKHLPSIKKVSFPIPQQFDKKQFPKARFIQITDVHIGPTLGPDFVNYLVKTINELQPHAVFITGDLLDGSVEQIGDSIKLFNALSAPVFISLGNHEYYWGHKSWSQFLENQGHHVLNNSSFYLNIEGFDFLISGVPDARMGRAEYSPEKAKITPHHRSPQKKTEESYNILLAHRPERIEEAATAGHHLQLSGHTHAGQFAPWTFVVSLVHRYYRGAYQIGDFWLYVGPGTGYWGPPLRTVSSEITLIEFT